MSSFRDLIQRRACLIVKEIFHDKRRSILNEKYCFYASHIIIIRQEFSEIVKDAAGRYCGKKKMKEIKKKRKETMRFAGLILQQFQGMSNPDSVSC